MGALEPGMPHAEAAGHLRQEVIGTLRHETGSLVDEAKFFGAVRAIMCDIDYVAALFAGWDGQDPRRISTTEKFRTFVESVFPAATGDQGYQAFAGHLYAMYRVGTVHLRHPKQLENTMANPSNRIQSCLRASRAGGDPRITRGRSVGPYHLCGSGSGGEKPKRGSQPQPQKD
jgi:hypothetical protein